MTEKIESARYLTAAQESTDQNRCNTGSVGTVQSTNMKRNAQCSVPLVSKGGQEFTIEVLDRVRGQPVKSHSKHQDSASVHSSAMLIASSRSPAPGHARESSRLDTYTSPARSAALHMRRGAASVDHVDCTCDTHTRRVCESRASTRYPSTRPTQTKFHQESITPPGGGYGLLVSRVSRVVYCTLDVQHQLLTDSTDSFIVLLCFALCFFLISFFFRFFCKTPIFCSKLCRRSISTPTSYFYG